MKTRPGCINSLSHCRLKIHEAGAPVTARRRPIAQVSVSRQAHLGRISFCFYAIDFGRLHILSSRACCSVVFAAFVPSSFWPLSLSHGHGCQSCVHSTIICTVASSSISRIVSSFKLSVAETCPVDSPCVISLLRILAYRTLHRVTAIYSCCTRTLV